MHCGEAGDGEWVLTEAGCVYGSVGGYGRRRSSSRAMLDTETTDKTFGAMTVDVSKVQAGVLQRFESWHKEMDKAFARVLQQHMQRLLSHLKDAREQLETFSGEGDRGRWDAVTWDAVELLNRMQALKPSKDQWQQLLNMLRQGERTLQKHRFKFPKDWTYVDMVDGEWMALIKVRGTATACAALVPEE